MNVVFFVLFVAATAVLGDEVEVARPKADDAEGAAKIERVRRNRLIEKLRSDKRYTAPALPGAGSFTRESGGYTFYWNAAGVSGGRIEIDGPPGGTRAAAIPKLKQEWEIIRDTYPSWMADAPAKQWKTFETATPKPSEFKSREYSWSVYAEEKETVDGPRWLLTLRWIPMD